jgi:cysteine-rich repeat protein
VTAAATGGTSATYQLFDLGEGGDPCATDRTCIDVRDSFGGALSFDSRATAVRWLSYDKRDNGLDGETTTVTLTVTCVEYVCGNSVVDPGEDCDDGDTSGNDGCSAECTVEAGWACAGTPSTCARTVCGDGRVQGTETCDDGDLVGGDGCSASCAIEDGYTCTGTPSSCVEGSGETCGEALALGTDATTSFTTADRIDDVSGYAGSCGFFSAEGPDVYYAVDVPGGRLLTATLSNDFNGSLLAIVDGCDDVGASCVVGTTGEAHYANHGAASQTVYVAVEGLLGDTNFSGQPRTPDAGAFTLTTSTRALSSAASAEVCATAAPLATGTPVNGTTVGRPGTANGFAGTGCNGFGSGINGGGRDAFYRVTVPAGRTLRAEVGSVTGDGDVVVGVVSDCTATRTACLAAQDGPSGTASETVRFTNTASAPREVFVVVDSLRSNAGFTFTLTATLE